MIGARTVAEPNFLTETQIQSPLAVVNLLAPSAQRRGRLKSQVSCAAWTFAALVAAAIYLVIPLSLAVHIAVHAVVLAVVISGAVLIELALVVTFIILKTEGPRE